MKWEEVKKMMRKNNQYSSFIDRREEHEETSLFLKITFFEQQFQMITISIMILITMSTTMSVSVNIKGNINSTMIKIFKLLLNVYICSPL